MGINSKNLIKSKLKIDEDMAYLIGAILGDGHISNSAKSNKDKSKDYRIILETYDFSFIGSFESMLKKFINTKSNTKIRNRENKRNITYYFQLRNKSFYQFLVNYIQIPPGSKSGILRVPEKFLASSNIIKKRFIAGLFDSDRGIRGRFIGFTMKNELFMEDVFKILGEIGFDIKKERWFNKKYDRYYYGLRFNKENTVKFLKELPLFNVEKLERIYIRTGIKTSS